MTDAHDEAQFVTVYPGWYVGRTVHIHFKILTAAVARRSFEFTSQLYCDDELRDYVHADQPYAAKGKAPREPGMIASSGVVVNNSC